MIKRVLQIGYLNPLKNYGGVEKYILNLSKSLKTSNDVTVDILCADSIPSIAKSAFGNIISLKVPFFENKNMFFVSKYLYGRLVRNYINRHSGEYDVFHFHGDNGLIGNKWSKKSILTLHGVAKRKSTIKGKIVSFLPAYIEKNNAKRAKRIFSVSIEAMEFFIKYNKEIQIIKQSVDTSLYHDFDPAERQKARDRLAIANDVIMGTIIGREPKRKGLSIAINAVESTGDQRLKLYAIGFPVEEIKDDIVKFTGNIDDDTKLSYLAASNFFIFPSRKEGFPISVLEAALCGIPLIVSKSAGVSELQSLVPFFREIESYDPQAYSSAIKDYIRFYSKKKPIEFKNNPLEREKFSIFNSTRIYMEAYESITKYS